MVSVWQSWGSRLLWDKLGSVQALQIVAKHCQGGAVRQLIGLCYDTEGRAGEGQMQWNGWDKAEGKSMGTGEGGRDGGGGGGQERGAQRGRKRLRIGEEGNGDGRRSVERSRGGAGPERREEGGRRARAVGSKEMREKNGPGLMAGSSR